MDLGTELTRSLRKAKSLTKAILSKFPDVFIGYCPYDMLLEAFYSLGFKETGAGIRMLCDLDYAVSFTNGEITYEVSGNMYCGDCCIRKINK